MQTKYEWLPSGILNANCIFMGKACTHMFGLALFLDFKALWSVQCCWAGFLAAQKSFDRDWQAVEKVFDANSHVHAFNHWVVTLKKNLFLDQEKWSRSRKKPDILVVPLSKGSQAYYSLSKQQLHTFSKFDEHYTLWSFGALYYYLHIIESTYVVYYTRWWIL